ncbi:MAG: UDP-3-O-(3-hydroxymyristoyl)glucosamine N-acyltransferase, partial [Bacteroidia bacterium]|nr:UDP-3-O-(3-hydroxymyristoyl)glucosamine N-acyltransferase [Bacteroidia bacterium]
MQLTAQALAGLLGAVIEGNSSVLLNTVAKIEEGFSGALSFLSNPKYEEHIYTTQSSAVLVRKDFSPSKPVSTCLIRVEDPYASFTFLLEKFSNPAAQLTGIEP